MLIRRLKAHLGVAPDQLIGVGTSATLGSGSQVEALARFATDIFDTSFDRSAIIGETRQTRDQFLGMLEYLMLDPGFTPEQLSPASYPTLLDYLQAQLRLFFGAEETADLATDGGRVVLGELLKKHPLTHNLLYKAHAGAVALQELIPAIHKQLPANLAAVPEAVLLSLLSLLAHARGGDYAGQPLVSLRVQLWARELRRIVASVGDDSAQYPVRLHFADDLKKAQGELYLPIVQCSECHTTAWLTRVEEGSSQVEQELRGIYNAFFAGDKHTRVLLPLQDRAHAPPSKGMVKQLCANCGHLQMQEGACAACQENAPVRVFEPDLNKSVREQGVPTLKSQRLCPVCQSRSSLILFGSRAASLSAVAIHQAYATGVNDDRKMIAFSDSVQDAAHRAGFFAARTWHNNVRMALSQAIHAGAEQISLPELYGSFPAYWRDPASNPHALASQDYIVQFIAPNMQAYEDYLRLTRGVYAEPREMLAGEVDAPGIFLNASMVLKRQMLAFCFDQWGLSEESEHQIPRSLQPVLDAVETQNQGKFPYSLLGFIKTHRDGLWERFEQLLDAQITDTTRNTLKAFLLGSGEGVVGIDIYLLDQLQQVVVERQSLLKQQKDLQSELRRLGKKPQDEATVNEIEELGRELAGIKHLKFDLNRKDTFNFLTDEGLLPNYAFPEEGTTLHSVIYRRLKKSKDGGETSATQYDSRVFEYTRPAHSALSELAPQSMFYASNRKVQIERVEMARGENLEYWRLCPNCSHSEKITGLDQESSCPRCNDRMWADASQLRTMVRLRQVYANTREDNAQLGDDSDTREPIFFNRQMLIDFDPADIALAYAAKGEGSAFGFEFVRKANFREINFGKQGSSDQIFQVAGNEMARPGFRLCRECGMVQHRRNKPEHLFKCQYKGAEGDEGIIDCLYLYREYESEAIRVLVPKLAGIEQETQIQSFVAAIHLGLKKRFGGKVDHLQLTFSDEPVPGSTERINYLVLYDTVPGGTGYLHELLSNHAALGGLRVRTSKDIINGKVGFKLELGERIYSVEIHPQLGAQQGVQYPCEPDYLITLDREDAQFLPVAVFLDGYNWHKAIVHEDLIKRQGISLSRHYLSWSLTWHDVNQAFAGNEVKIPNPLRDNTEQAPWPFVHQVSRDKGLDAHNALAELTPMLLLLQYLNRPDPHWWRRFALLRALCWLDASRMQQPEAIASVLAPAKAWPSQFQDQLAGMQTLFAGRADFSEATARLTVAIGGGELAIKALDPEALFLAVTYGTDDPDTPLTRRAWRKLLQILNIGQFIPVFFAGTEGGILDGSFSALQWASQAEAPVQATAWDALFKELDDEVVDWLTELAAADIPQPEVCYELVDEEGVVIAEAELAWLAAKVALLMDYQLEDSQRVFAAHGWQVVTLASDNNTVMAMLGLH